MGSVSYDAQRTALLVVDPYNDFLAEGGKLWPLIQPVADEVNLLDNLRTLLQTARAARIQVMIVPHRRWQPDDYESWRSPNPSLTWPASAHNRESVKSEII